MSLTVLEFYSWRQEAFLLCGEIRQQFCLSIYVCTVTFQTFYPSSALVASRRSALAACTQGAAVCCILARLVYSRMNVVSTGRPCWIFGYRRCFLHSNCPTARHHALRYVVFTLIYSLRSGRVLWLRWPLTGWIVSPTVKLQNSYMQDRVRH